jgi:hypothetical protein
VKYPNNLIDPLAGSFRLADAWRMKGNLEQAKAGYRQILRVAPGFVPAVFRLGDLLEAQADLSQAERIYRQALAENPDEASLHKRFINAVARQRGLQAAFDHYRLQREDSRPINLSAAEILCCAVVRNESVRLPYFLNYYRQKGVTRFFVVDNDSTDDTARWLSAQPDVHIWRSTYSYHKAHYGTAWVELLLRRYGVGRWCLIVDADELLYYADCENRSLPQLCWELDRKNKRALKAILLDMYAAKPIKETNYLPGQDFLTACPYFDRRFYHQRCERPTFEGPQTIYAGGARERVFRASGDYYLSKVPLLKYHADCTLSPHWTNLPETEVAGESGCLLHFKYFASFPAYVVQEVERKQHYGHLFQYEAYAEELAHNETLTLYDEAESIKFEDSQQLVRLGIVKLDSREST